MTYSYNKAHAACYALMAYRAMAMQCDFDPRDHPCYECDGDERTCICDPDLPDDNPWHRPGSYSDAQAGRVCASIDMMLAGGCDLSNTDLGLPSTLVARLQGVDYDVRQLTEPSRFDRMLA